MTEHTENDAGPCPLCGSVAGYADGPPCLTCHYEPSAENDAVMKPNEDGSAADPTRVHTARYAALAQGIRFSDPLSQ